MRHTAIILLGLTLTAGAAQGQADAQTRVLSEINGWRAFEGTSAPGQALCGLETRDPRTGRHFLLQQSAGARSPELRLSRGRWNLGGGSSRTVRLVVDQHRVFVAEARIEANQLRWSGPLDSFEPAFRQGRVMRVEFPAGPDAPWNLSLTGTNAVMTAFAECRRRLVQAPEAPPARSWEPDKTPPLPDPPPSHAPSGDDKLGAKIAAASAGR